MNKTLLLTLAIVAGVSCSEAIAKNKKKNTPAEANVPAQKTIVTLQSKSDSISYAAGKSLTQGMMPYVQQQLKVDTAYIADFINGLRNALNTDDTPQQNAEAAGRQIAKMLKENMLPRLKSDLAGSDSLNVDLLKRAFVDAVENDNSVLSFDESSTYFENTMKAIQEKKEAEKKAENLTRKAEGEKWLAENAKKAGVITTASGLQYKVIKQGTGDIATKDDEVVVKYEGKLTNGKVFDASEKHGGTATFKPGQVIKGWTEALTMMPAGSEWELYIPQDLAYGERGAGQDIPAFSALIFKVEVVEVKKAEVKADAPAAADKKTTTKKAPAKKTPAKKTVKK